MEAAMPLAAALYARPEPVEDEEAQLVERAKRDREAFGALYRRHYSMIAGYIYRRIGHVQATEDLVAEVFLSAMRHLPRYRSRGTPLKAWLYRIATNRVTRWVKRERRRLIVEEAGAVARQSGTCEPSVGPDAEAARRALLVLRPKHQAVLALHHLEGMSVEEIARTLGCRVGTVKSRLSRGRAALRAKLVAGPEGSGSGAK